MGTQVLTRTCRCAWGTWRGPPFLGTRPNMSESHSETSTRVPFCIASQPTPTGALGDMERHMAALAKKHKVTQPKFAAHWYGGADVLVS